MSTNAKWIIGLLVAIVIGLVVGLVIDSGDDDSGNATTQTPTITTETVPPTTQTVPTETVPTQTTTTPTETVPQGNGGGSGGTTSPSGL